MFELTFKGRRVKVSTTLDKASSTDIRRLLEGLYKLEYADRDLRASVVRQLKNELLAQTDEDIMTDGWWDLPGDLLRTKETSQFLTMEADLNPALHYEKTSFSLKLLVHEQGKLFVFDREQLHTSLRKLGLHDRLKKTSSVLVRLKGAISAKDRAEVEDYFRKNFSVDRMKIVFDRKQYGERVSVELVLFGDYIIDHNA